MARLINKRDVALYVEELTEQKNYGIPYIKLDRSNKGRGKGKIELYPITIVNLLGKYGNFETDSNDDGIADGWALPDFDTFSLNSSKKVLGTSSQYAKRVNFSGTTKHPSVQTSLSLPSSEMRKYFIFAYVQKTASDTSIHKFSVYQYDSNQSFVTDVSEIIDNLIADKWIRAYKTFQTAANVAYILPRLTCVTADTQTAEIYVDGFMLIDLTEMGELPPPLKEFFQNQVSNWEDLATTSNITATDGRTQTGEDWLAELLPYTDSVQTLGYIYDKGELNIIVENKGKNLLPCDLYQIDRVINSWYALASNNDTAFVGNTLYWLTQDGSGTSLLFRKKIPVKPNTTYTLSVLKISRAGLVVKEYENEQALESGENISTKKGGAEVTTMSFTTSNNCYYILVGINELTFSGIGYASGFQLIEGTTTTSYILPRSSSFILTTELWGYNDKFDYFLGNGAIIKQWQRLSADGSLSWHYARNGENFHVVYINYSDMGDNVKAYNWPIVVKYDGKPLFKQNPNGAVDSGDKFYGWSGNLEIGVFHSDSGWVDDVSPNDNAVRAYFNGWKATANNGLEYTAWEAIGDPSITSTNVNYVSNTKVTEVAGYSGNWRPYEIIYQLAKPIIQNCDPKKLKIFEDNNYITITHAVKNIYSGDGLTVTFNLSKTADDTGYQVYLNGEPITKNITKTTTSFTFDEAPKNGALIEVYYNVSYPTYGISVETLEPTGNEELLDFITNLSINVQNHSRTITNVFGEQKVKALNEVYQIRFTRNLLENIDDFYLQYKDKTFRMKILNISTNEVEYLSPCKIVSADKDYFGRVQNLSIIALDYYKS